MNIIFKQFTTTYAHRVWSQSLDAKYSVDKCTVCRHLHSHPGVISVGVTADKLTAGMVVDFKYLNWFKRWLDDVVDHKFIIDINDPAFERITGRTVTEVKDLYTLDNLESSKIGYFPLRPTMVEDAIAVEIDNEITESFVIVDFVPTSENLSKWMFDIVADYMRPLDITVKALSFKETMKSEAVYYA